MFFIRAESLYFKKLQSRLLKVLREVRLSLVNTIDEFFVAIVNTFQLLGIVTKNPMLNVAGDLHPLQGIKPFL